MELLKFLFIPLGVAIPCFIISIMIITIDYLLVQLRLRNSSLLGVDYAVLGFFRTMIFWALGAALVIMLLCICASAFEQHELVDEYKLKLATVCAVAWPVVFSRIIQKQRHIAIGNDQN